MPAYPSPSCSPFAAAESAFSALQMRLKEAETLSLQHDDVEVLVETQAP